MLPVQLGEAFNNRNLNGVTLHLDKLYYKKVFSRKTFQLCLDVNGLINCNEE